MDTSTYLDEDTAGYFGSDVSSVTDGQPDGFNDVVREEEYVESDTSSSTDGLIDGFNDRAEDDDIGPDPAAVMQSVGDGGGGDASPDGPLTDLADGGSAAVAPEASVAPAVGSSSASESEGGSEGPDEGEGDDEGDDDPSDPAPTPTVSDGLSMDNSLAELQQAARDAEVSDKGTKAEILERISNPHGA